MIAAAAAATIAVSVFVAGAPERPRGKDGDDDRRRARGAPAKQRHGPVAIPIDVGVGPALLFPNPPALQDQVFFTGLDLSLAAIIDKKLINEHRDQIPAGLRGAARGLTEVRYRPWFLALVPERLIVSPQLINVGANTGMYGAVWRPLGIGVGLVNTKAFDISLNGAVDAAAIFIHSASLGGGTVDNNSITVFLRPGLNLSLTAEWQLSDALVLSGGWSSDLFIPQPIGGSPFTVEPLDQSLWHMGGPFIMLHVRIPYQVTL